MPRREGTKKQIIGRLVDELSQEILAMDIGSKASIARLVQLHYELDMRADILESIMGMDGQRIAAKPMSLPAANFLKSLIAS